MYRELRNMQELYSLKLITRTSFLAKQISIENRCNKYNTTQQNHVCFSYKKKENEFRQQRSINYKYAAHVVRYQVETTFTYV